MEGNLNSINITNMWLLLDAMTTPALLPPLIVLEGFTNNKVVIWAGILVNNIHDGVCSPDASHRSATNVYLSRYPDPVLNKYGEREWESKIINSPTCKKYVCIVRFINHMFRDVAEIFVDTVHKFDWGIYHDALTFFTSRDSM